MPAPVAQGLRIRKLADRSEGERVPVYDPETGDSWLTDPATEGTDPEPWPLAGIELIGGAPKRVTVPTKVIWKGVSEGWIEVEEETLVHRSGGPPEDAWRLTHTFRHIDAFTIDTVDGPVRYEVTQQPDKWPDEKDGDAGFGGDVRHVYVARLVS
jgi:hypothetical protein